MTKSMPPMPPYVRSALMAEAKIAAPREICGFILPGWEIVYMRNVATDPNRFAMDDEDLVEFFTLVPDPVGMFHSHPDGRDTPSDVDRDYAPQGLRYWIVTFQNVIEWNMSYDPPAFVG